MTKPSIFMPDSNVGYHNTDLDRSNDRLEKASAYKDLSTIAITPTRGYIHARVVMAIKSLMAPMNQKFIHIFPTGMEVGAAYNSAIELILNNPDLSKWKYILTLEDDNLPPPDGLLKLFETINGIHGGTKYDVVSGLYWTKGPEGMPMIYGSPTEVPLNFRPIKPKDNDLVRCNGTGMGFCLYRLDLFKDTKIEKPWFKTEQSLSAQGVKAYTQDLYFAEKLCKAGYLTCVDCRVKVGHLDVPNRENPAETFIW